MSDSGSIDLVGRSTERDLLESFLRETGARGPVVAVVDGAPGIGKTTLVESFLDAHPEVPSFFATCVEWASNHRFWVAEQLLRAPLAATDPLDVAREFGSVASAVPADQPFVVVLDDAHWADLPSLQAMTSAVHQIHQPALIVLITTSEPPEKVDPQVLDILDRHRRRIHVGPLDETAVRRLADTVAHVDLPAPVARQLARHTGGNPRHLRQLLREVDPTEWGRWKSVLPVPRTFAATVLAHLSSCSHPTRTLVESAAVFAEESLFAYATELAAIEHPLEALDEAHRRGLLDLTARRGVAVLAFPSPLTRAAVYLHLPPLRLRELHRRAAEIVEDEGERLDHLAAATPLGDAGLADELDRFAVHRAEMGAWSTVADALIKSSRITADRTVRERRLIRAVDALVGAGNLPQALAFAPEIESFPPSPLRDSVLGYLAILRGRPAEADLLLNQAWAAAEPENDPATAAVICQRRVLDSLSRWHGPDLVEWGRRAVALVDPGDPSAVESAAVMGLGLAATGRVEEARVAYDDLSAKVARGAQSQRFEMARGWLDLALDDPESARRELESAVPTAFRMGSVRISLWAQAWLARTQFVLGDWDDAIDTVSRAARQIDDVALDLVRPLVHWTGAQTHALRGNWPAAHEHLRLAGASAHDYPIMFIPFSLARAQCAEVEADYLTVIRALEPIARMQPREGIDEPGFWPWPDVYANALVMAGRVDDADAFLVPHEQRAAERGHRSAMARLGYARGRVIGARGDIEAARRAFEDALAQLDALPLPYDRARVNFAYGQTLRRAGKRRDADAVIQAAREGYSALGATSYVQRCDRELKAGGLNIKRSAFTLAELTPQERAVTELVAAGASNKEAAGELFLSVKTVQYHLTRVYAKLGIRSRSELAAQFREEG
ncbi:MAG: LuxR C-terminal-related transcriptional regulator [Rhodococcus sp. (in: high G+C Gram-positive bacteria)]|uniref:helix-turn-helix transcriptional regulator n=1 Tax=Rhodococcus sp. TaxID=1831 RepID=UPI003BAF75DD